MGKQPLKRFFLFTSPRTASNLLMRILNLDEQPSIASAKQRDYFFLGTLKWQVGDELCRKPLNQWSRAERDGIFATYQSGFDSLQTAVEDGEAQGKDLFLKEHLNFMLDPVAESRFLHEAESTDEVPWTVETDYNSTLHTPLNPTVLPDDILKTCLPTLLIRHPAKVFPSFQRVSFKLYGETKATTEEIALLGTSLHWSRMLYDWFAGIHSNIDKDHWPLVLDADDFISDPELVNDYAKVVGLDTSKLKFAWDAVSEEVQRVMPETMKTMGASLIASIGIVKTENPRDIDITEEAKKWKEEFGDDVAQKLERRVRDAMPDYEYLWSRRFQKETGKT